MAAPTEGRPDGPIRPSDATTVVPAEFFEDLFTALDAPAIPAPTLAEAMQQADDLIDRS